MYLQKPIDQCKQIAIITRFSTEEQRRESTQAQFEYCHEFLREHGVTNASVIHISDEGVSGEVIERPGILRFREAIRAGQCELAIAEDSSRIYRGVGPCIQLVGIAVDSDVRVICINDFVDTANEDWQQRLEEAQRHHGQDNFYTRFRIKRAHDHLWKIGAAIGLLRPGYTREREFPDDPKSARFDKIDSAHENSILTAFQDVSTGVPLDIVADFLTDRRVPKTSNSTKPAWTKQNVISMIRCTIYRGFQTYRVSVNKKQHSTGKSRNVPNPDPDKILEREMPHLRIVPDDVWNLANRAIDNRSRSGANARGKQHVLYGIPRDSRSPLSNIFICGVCKSKMHMTGRNEGGYRCSRAKVSGKKPKCWNRATARRELTHTNIGTAISQQILSQAESAAPELVLWCKQLLITDSKLDRQEDDLKKRRHKLKIEQDRLLKVLKSDDPSDFIYKEVEGLRAQQAELESELQILKARAQRSFEMPTDADILDSIRAAATSFSHLTRESNRLLQSLLVGPIVASPFQQFGGNKVVLRAEFTVQLVGILPWQIRAFAEGREYADSDNHVFQRKLTVNLFEPSLAPKHANQALRIFEESSSKPPTLAEVGRQLGISKRSAHLALQMGREMRAAGVDDPYVRLEEEPENASRWGNKRSA